jgi:hypothetical protein
MSFRLLSAVLNRVSLSFVPCRHFWVDVVGAVRRYLIITDGEDMDRKKIAIPDGKYQGRASIMFTLYALLLSGLAILVVNLLYSYNVSQRFVFVSLPVVEVCLAVLIALLAAVDIVHNILLWQHNKKVKEKVFAWAYGQYGIMLGNTVLRVLISPLLVEANKYESTGFVSRQVEVVVSSGVVRIQLAFSEDGFPFLINCETGRELAIQIKNPPSSL